MKRGSHVILLWRKMDVGSKGEVYGRMESGTSERDVEEDSEIGASCG